MDRYDQGLDLQAQARDLRAKADRMEQQGVVVKGDKERARQQQREEMDKVVEKGSKWNSPATTDTFLLRCSRFSRSISLGVVSGASVAEREEWVVFHPRMTRCRSRL
jgi:hypothetical protein